MHIDESGDFGTKEGSSKFLILSALVVNEPKDLDRIIKNTRRNKFEKGMWRGWKLAGFGENKEMDGESGE